MTLSGHDVGPGVDVCQRLGTRFVKTLLCRGVWDANLYTADAILWRNACDYQCPLFDAVAARAVIAATAARFSVVGVELRAWADGFVVEFAYAVTLSDATTLRVPGCIVGAVKGARICLVHEYVDSVAIAPLHEAVHRQYEGACRARLNESGLPRDTGAAWFRAPREACGHSPITPG